MRALFCAPPNVAFLGECGGVFREMRLREGSLRAIGHEVDYLSSWESPNWSAYDLCHLFMANGDSFSIGAIVRRHLPLVVSPIIDRVNVNTLLRVSTWLDSLVPAVFTHIGRCARLCQMADIVCLRSREEEGRLRNGLGVTVPGAIVPCPIEEKKVAPEAGRFQLYSGKPYALFLGDAGNPRKNVERLIRSVRGLDIDLLIGGMVSDTEAGRRVRNQADRTSNVHMIGLVSEGEKAFLLANAKVFVLPSFMEGIGLAAMEAGLAGATIVITINGGPADYLGTKAYYVNPYSVGDIREKIRSAFHAPLIASSYLRKAFSREATGRSLEACYQRCVDSGRCATDPATNDPIGEKTHSFFRGSSRYQGINR